MTKRAELDLITLLTFLSIAAAFIALFIFIGGLHAAGRVPLPMPFNGT